MGTTIISRANYVNRVARLVAEAKVFPYEDVSDTELAELREAVIPAILKDGLHLPFPKNTMIFGSKEKESGEPLRLTLYDGKTSKIEEKRMFISYRSEDDYTVVGYFWLESEPSAGLGVRLVVTELYWKKRFDKIAWFSPSRSYYTNEDEEIGKIMRRIAYLIGKVILYFGQLIIDREIYTIEAVSSPTPTKDGVASKAPTHKIIKVRRPLPKYKERGMPTGRKIKRGYDRIAHERKYEHPRYKMKKSWVKSYHAGPPCKDDATRSIEIVETVPVPVPALSHSLGTIECENK